MSEAEHIIETKFGNMTIVFTEAAHCHVSYNRDDASALTINGVRYRVSAHLYVNPVTGRFEIGEADKNTYERRMSLHGAREEWSGKYSDSMLTNAARERVAPAITDAVNQFAASHPDVVWESQREYLADRLAKTVDAMQAARLAWDEARSAHATATDALTDWTATRAELYAQQ